MATERIVIELRSRGVRETAQDIRAIATEARRAQGFIDGFRRNLTSIKTEADKAQSSLRTVRVAMSATASGSSRTANEVARLNRELAALGVSTGKVQTQFTGFKRNLSTVNSEANRAQNSLNQLKRAQNNVGSESKRTEGAIRSLERATASLARQAGAAATAQRALQSATARTGSSARGAVGVFALLKGAIAGVSVALLIREYVQLSNVYQQLQNRIRLVTTSQAQQAAVNAELLTISNSTFTSLRDTTELYARLAFNLRGLGATQREVLDVTKTLNQAVILSGASSREASNAIIQLSQGLASGTLRGDELRSVLEQLPFVADLIAQGLDVSRGALRRLGSEGEITSEIVFRALQKGAAETEAQFKQLTPTIGQAFTVVQNSILAAVGEFNKATGASGALANAIIKIGENILDFSDIAIPLFEDLSDAIGQVGTFVEDVFGIKFSNSATSASEAVATVILFINQIAANVVGAGKAILAFFDAVGNNLVGIGQRTINAAAGAIEGVVNLIIRGLNKAIDGLETSLNGVIDVANSVSDFLGQGQAFDRISVGSLVDLNLGRVEERQFKDVGEQAANAFNQGFDEFIAPVNEFIDSLFVRQRSRRDARNANSQKALLDEQLKQERVRRTVNDILIAQLAEQLNKESALLDVRGKSRVQLAQEEALASFRERLKKDQISLNDAQRDELELIVKANAEKKIRNELDEQVRKFNEDLQDELRLLELTVDQREVESRLLPIIRAQKEAFGSVNEAEIQQLREQIQLIQRRNSLEETRNRLFADKAAIDREQANLDQLRAQGADETTIGRAELDLLVERQKGLQTFESAVTAGLARTISQISDWSGQVQDLISGAFGAAEDAVVEFVKTGEFNFSKLVDSILEDLLRLLTRQAITGLFGSLLGGPFASAAPALFSSFGARAAGGNVTADRPVKVGEFGPELFVPRTAGTIVANGAMEAPAVNVTVVNVTDPNEVSASLADPRNDQLILNALKRNRGAVQQITG